MWIIRKIRITRKVRITNYLVVKDQATIDEGTGKVQKAQDGGVKIITKVQLIKLID